MTLAERANQVVLELLEQRCPKNIELRRLDCRLCLLGVISSALEEERERWAKRAREMMRWDPDHFDPRPLVVQLAEEMEGTR